MHRTSEVSSFFSIVTSDNRLSIPSDASVSGISYSSSDPVTDFFDRFQKSIVGDIMEATGLDSSGLKTYDVSDSVDRFHESDAL